ncbi:MAG: hypothetical protein M5U34_29665 [Chloroflexi bacterium]|nr:hypothetical protein [Chloroflexota bacterium]
MHENDVFGSIMGMFMMMCIMLPMLAIVIGSVVWAYKDAVKRGKSGWLVALMVFFISWPAGLLIWLVFRPDKIEGVTHTGKIVDDDEYPNPEEYK